MIRRSVVVTLDIAHCGIDGTIHGHSLTVEVYTKRDVDLVKFSENVKESIAFIGHGLLEHTIKGRTFEDVAEVIMEILQEDAVIIRIPSAGFMIELTA